MFDARQVACCKHFLHPKVLLPVDVLLSYSLLPVKYAFRSASPMAANDFAV
jgi:hypothetical protein